MSGPVRLMEIIRPVVAIALRLRLFIFLPEMEV